MELNAQLIEDGIRGKALSSAKGRIDYGDILDETCIRKVSLCPRGVTLSLWFRILIQGETEAENNYILVSRPGFWVQIYLIYTIF